ncbi:MAG: MGMT family protein [Proteobacteria bacterium]|nr:MGMT family protein [Pseudomonadota bacterium]
MSPTRQRRARGFTSVPKRHRFFDRVWETVRKIPRGSVTTYGFVASVIPRPDGVTLRHFKTAGARWVGQAMAQCPADVPWHRVINAQGKISRRRSGDGHRIQRMLLEEEGVAFEKGGRIDLHLFGWTPRSSRKRQTSH